MPYTYNPFINNLDNTAIGGSGGIGNVVGPASSTTNDFAQFADTTGKLLKDGGYSPSSFLPASTLTQYDVLIGGTSNSIVSVTNGTSGQVLTANTGAAPTWQAAGGGSGFTSIVVQTFLSSNTYTPTSGMAFCIVELVGGGSGGAGAGVTIAAHFSVGGGGCGGNYIRKTFAAATIGASQSVTIGAGGAGGSGTTGHAGVATTFGALMSTSVVGGFNVTSDTATNTSANGDTPAPGIHVPTGYDILRIGSAGAPGFAVLSGMLSAGNGGGSYFGGDVIGPGLFAPNTSSAGTDAPANSGSGGSGAQNAASQGAAVVGGAGGSGIAIITEYII